MMTRYEIECIARSANSSPAGRLRIANLHLKVADRLAGRINDFRDPDCGEHTIDWTAVAAKRLARGTFD